jgi:hypothetical protein
VIAAVWVLPTVKAEAVKFALLAPAGTVTLAGTVTTVVPANVTFSPPAGAAALNVTVQLAFAGVTREPGVQVSAWTVVAGGCHPFTVIVPPLPDTIATLPLPVAPIGLLTPTATDPLLVLAARVAVATATTPLAIDVAFIPVARHFTLPLLFWQEIVLPAAVSAALAVTLTDVTSAGANVKVHSSAAGALAVLRERLRGTEAPSAAAPEARLKVVCPKAHTPGIKNSRGAETYIKIVFNFAIFTLKC